MPNDLSASDASISQLSTRNHLSNTALKYLIFTNNILHGLAQLQFKLRIRIRFELISWYWHFVDVVWVFVFTTVYIVGMRA